jgi:hypothetical protein
LAKVFKPGLLSIIGTGAVFALAWLFLTTPTSTHSGGSESSLAAALGLFFGLVIGAWGLLLLGFSIVLFVDWMHHRIWGTIVAFLYGLGFIIVLPSSSDLATSFSGVAGLTAYVLGFIGGIWGLFSGTHLTPSGIWKGIVGPAGRVFLGGLVSFIALALFGASIFLLAPFVMMLGPLLIHVGSKRRTIVGVVLLGASLATVLPPVVIILAYLALGRLTSDYSNIPSFLAIILAGLLAVSGAYELISRRPNET